MAETGVLIKGGDKDKVCLEVAGSGRRERRGRGPGHGGRRARACSRGFYPVSMSSCLLLIQGSILF